MALCSNLLYLCSVPYCVRQINLAISFSSCCFLNSSRFCFCFSSCFLFDSANTCNFLASSSFPFKIFSLSWRLASFKAAFFSKSSSDFILAFSAAILAFRSSSLLRASSIALRFASASFFVKLISYAVHKRTNHYDKNEFNCLSILLFFSRIFR